MAQAPNKRGHAQDLARLQVRRGVNAARMELARALRAQGVDARELTQLRVTAASEAVQDLEAVYDLLDYEHGGQPVWGAGERRIYLDDGNWWRVVPRGGSDAAMAESQFDGLCCAQMYGEGARRLPPGLRIPPDCDLWDIHKTHGGEGQWVTEPGVKVNWEYEDMTAIRFNACRGLPDRLALCDQLERSLDDRTHSDFTVELKGGEHIAVHKCIIAARCGLAAGIIRTGERAPEYSRLVIDDLDPAPARCLVRFIYTGRLPADGLSAADIATLCTAADKYEVPGLASAALDMLRAALRRDAAGVWRAIALPLLPRDAVLCCLECVAGLGKSPESLSAACELAAAGHPLAGAACAALSTGAVDEDFVVGARDPPAAPAAKRRRGEDCVV